MTKRAWLFGGGVAVSIAIGAFAASCGSSSGSTTDNGGGDTGAGGGDGSLGDTDFVFDSGANDDGSNGDGSLGDSTATGFDGAPPVDAAFPCDGCTTFPPPTTPECTPTTLAAPTIAYPPNGTLLPPNMNVLEVQWTPSTGATVYDVEFSNAVTNVRVETPCNPVPNVRGGASLGCGLTLPLAAWLDIANENRDGDPVKVTVRATADGSCVATSTTDVKINFAREDLAGGIYYWQSATFGGIGGKTGGIYSHDFGTFDPTPTPFYTSGGTGTCIGCHNLSRDGARMSLASDDPDADDEFGDENTHLMDVATRTVLGGKSMSPGFQTFTHDHAKLLATTFKTFKNADISVFSGDGATDLADIKLPTGILATHIDLAKDDVNFVFVDPGPLPSSGGPPPPGGSASIDKSGDHHFLGGSIYTAKFDAAANTLTTPTLLLAPASGSTTNYYYPSWSPDGSFLVLDEAPSDDAFYNRNARVKLLRPTAGSTPIDLPALNVADGLSNSWPRWSPFVQIYKGHRILWLTFSSNRDYGLHLVNHGLNADGTKMDNCYPPEGPTNALYANDPQPLSKTGVGYTDCTQPQIWMAAVIVDPDATLDTKDRSFPAFWLPFQDVNSHNHSAQWVEKVLSGPNPGGDAGPGGDASGDGASGDASGTDTAPACVEQGASCTSSLCCSDVVCCNGTCQYTCIR